MVCAFRFTGSSTTVQWKWLRGSSNAADGHQIRIIDVDGNGTDEICDIGYCLNSNGTLRYSLAGQGIIHGDRTQIGKLDPNRAGMQGYGVQQDNPSGLLEYYYDANTGTVLWKHMGGVSDVDRGAAGDIDPRYNGWEVWSFYGVYNAPSNTKLTDEPSRPYPNFRIWWDGDVLSENLHDEKIEKWNYTSSSVSRLVTMWNFDGAGGSDRNAPMFYGDILGDWREEVILVTDNNSKLVVFTTNVPTNTRLYTLAHNPAYRNCMTIKGYMQSHLTDYYLGNGMATPPAPNISYTGTAARMETEENAFPVTTVTSPFEIYPNPNNGAFINVNVPVKEKDDLVFTITNEQGQLLFEKKLGAVEAGDYSTRINISRARLAPGNYIASIRSKSGIQSRLFVKL